MLNVLRRRAPNVAVIISPVRVQGIGAAAEIATAINELAAPNEAWEPIDLIVVTRGGGSIEDLWEFNEEIVARAIFHSAIPVVSAVGHEIDFTHRGLRRGPARADAKRGGGVDRRRFGGARPPRQRFGKLPREMFAQFPWAKPNAP